ncbi:hypothetical protein KTJ32_13655 [Acinetobacter gyllenbergii]|uniref:hypothetical protein n=1 Tax=Acinetobacter gyllenbergii TaxID=134534 RepID=UPI0021CFBF75|nr:hypothetical protein [Acinetobacter gyllenbergii]MCU4582036.1 hypothetical protein [Acinetobacter gyllenbergii]
MYRQNMLSAIFLFLCLYIYVAAFSFSGLITDDLFYLGLNVARISIVSVLLLCVFLINGIQKSTISFFVFAAVFLLLFDSFFTALSYLVIISLIFYTYLLNFNEKGKVGILVWVNRTSILAFLSILFLYVLGVMPNNVYDTNGDYAADIRQSLGFSNPNPGSLFILQSVFISFLLKDKTSFLISLALFIGSSFYFVSKTSIVLAILFFVLIVFMKYKYINNIASFLFLFGLVLFPFFVVKFISNGMWTIGGVNLDLLFTTRLSEIRRLYLESGGVGFLPYPNVFFVDSALSNLLIKGGWFLYFTFLVLAFIFTVREKNYLFKSAFIVLVCFSFSENIFNGNLLLTVLLFVRFFNILLKKNKSLVT